MDNDVDLTPLEKDQLLEGLGDVILSLVSESGAAIVVSREDGAMTFLNPVILREIPPEMMAQALLNTWEEDSVELFLKKLYG